MKKIICHSLILAGFISIFASCSKKEAVDNITTGEVSISSTAPGFSKVDLSTDVVQEDINALLIKLETGVTAKTDINIYLQLDNNLITAYNTANSRSYVPMPSNTYQLLNPGGLTVTIPKGESQVYLRLKIIKSAFDFANEYALGFTISAVPIGLTISPTAKSVVLAVNVRNKYDGLYDMTSTLTDIANGALGPYPGAKVALKTSGLNTVDFINMVPTVGAWFNIPFFPISSAGAFSVYGGWAPVFTFNSSDQITAVTNYYGNPNPANTRGAVIDPTGINNFALVSGVKTVRAKFIMTQPSVVPAAPHHRTFIDATLSYTGPR